MSRRAFGKQSVPVKCAEYFIRRYVQETEARSQLGLRYANTSALLQQRKCAYDIGLDELDGPSMERST